MKKDRPPAKTPEKFAWVRERLRVGWAAAGSPPVEYFTLAAFRKHCPPPVPCYDDFPPMGGWKAALMSAVGGTAAPADAEIHVEVEAPVYAQPKESAYSGVPVDPLPPRHHLRGVSSLIGPDGTLKAQWVKTAADHESHEELIARLMSELPTRVPVRDGPIARPRPGPADEAALLAAYPLGDPHVGLMSWAPESSADFDLKICEDLMVRAMRDLVLRGPRARRALIVNLGDFFHSDNAHGHTTNSAHALDLDGRSAKVMAVGLRIMTTLIDAALEHHEEVTVDNRIGNHDAHTSLMLSIALAAFYRLEPRVSIPATVSHRAYHTHGACLIGTTHGDRAKMEQLGAIMAAERAEDWGRSRHRYWYTGHIHHQVVKEYAGCRVESFRTLAARDSWHAAQGYVSGRDLHRISLHAEHGEVGREIVNVDALLRQRAA